MIDQHNARNGIMAVQFYLRRIKHRLSVDDEDMRKLEEAVERVRKAIENGDL